MPVIDEISFEYFLNNMEKAGSKTYWCLHNGYRYGEKMKFDKIEISFYDANTQTEIVCSNEDNDGNLRMNSFKEAYIQFVEKACMYSEEVKENFLDKNNPEKYRLYSQEEHDRMTSENLSSTRVNDSRTVKLDGKDYYVAQNLKIGEFIKICCERVPAQKRSEYMLKLYEYEKNSFGDTSEEWEYGQIETVQMEVNVVLTDDKGKATATKKNNSKHISKKIDFNELNQKKKRLGNIGEDIVYRYERDSLIDAGKKELAEKVELVSRTQGDGLGYDIVSYTPEGQEVYIEVKTTKQNRVDDFYITPNEIEASKKYGDRYKIYRLYALKMAEGSTNLKIYSGPFNENGDSLFKLEPVSYRVSLREQ